jgi:hypothetical protein
MFPPVASPSSLQGHCPHCNCWVAINLKKCPHCKESFSPNQMAAIKQEGANIKQARKNAFYFLVVLVIVLGLYVITDLQLYKKWF